MNEEYDNNQYETKIWKRVLIGIIVTLVAFIVIKWIISFINSYTDTYNELVALQEKVEQSQSEVENAMQRRAELMPDLVETLKASDAHDEKLYAEVSSASENLLNVISKDSSADVISDADYELSLAINRMLVFVKEYPDIIDKNKYSRFMTQLEGSVNRILVARSDYNEIVGVYNTKVRQYPGMIVAKIFGFDTAEYFKADEAAKKELNVVNFD